MYDINKIDINRLCDRCIRHVDGDMYSVMVDDKNRLMKAFKGHKECMEIVGKTLEELYGYGREKQ